MNYNMWFLKGRPTSINVKALIASVSGGYQQTSYRFSVQADGKVWIALATPWAPHKPNGSFKIVENNLLTLLEENSGNTEDVTVLGDDDIEIWERLRSLKAQPNIELVHVQELINWYLDDIGVITFWAEPGKTYQINYTHKIASDSHLFLPTRLPTIIASHKPDIQYKVWVVNGIVVDLQTSVQRDTFDPQLHELLKESQGSLDLLKFTEWDWDEDTRISTDNWESSDDEWETSEEDSA